VEKLLASDEEPRYSRENYASKRMKKILFLLTCDGDVIYEAIQELFDEYRKISQCQERYKVKGVQGCANKHILDGTEMEYNGITG